MNSFFYTECFPLFTALLNYKEKCLHEKTINHDRKEICNVVYHHLEIPLAALRIPIKFIAKNTPLDGGMLKHPTNVYKLQCRNSAQFMIFLIILRTLELVNNTKQHFHTTLSHTFWLYYRLMLERLLVINMIAAATELFDREKESHVGKQCDIFPLAWLQ